MSEAQEEEGGVGVFAEEEATRKRQKKENGVSKINRKYCLINCIYYYRKIKLAKLLIKRRD